jgi:hypothetical protein
VAGSEELVAFVHQALSRGLSRAQIADALRTAGWSAEQVRAALASFADVDFPIPIPRPRPYLTAREAFLYVVLFSTLYFTAYNLGAIAFELIDRAFPDAVARGSSPYTLGAIRWSVSALVVAFPVFLFVATVLAREIRRDPAKRASKVRKNLTYLTLFMGSCILIGDVTTLVYNLLGGELTVRFMLKVATVAVIAGTIFGYYLSDIRRDEAGTAAR